MLTVQAKTHAERIQKAHRSILEAVEISLGASHTCPHHIHHTCPHGASLWIADLPKKNVLLEAIVEDERARLGNQAGIECSESGVAAAPRLYPAAIGEDQDEDSGDEADILDQEALRGVRHGLRPGLRFY